MKEEILRMEHIYVKRRGKYVLSDFRLNVYKGELVVLFGFSGSGVHELGDVLSGGGEIERGRILIDEKEVQMKKHYYPEEYGIFVIHDKNNLLPDLTVAENLFFGGRKRLFSMVVSEKKQERLAEQILEKFQMQMDVHRKAKNLSYYEEMILKMIKAYVKGAKLIVINEIVELTYIRERAQMIRVINLLKQDGIAVVWVNQRIEYVQELADRVVVLRDGKNVKSYYGRNYSKDALIRTATDSRVREEEKRPVGNAGEQLLELRNITSEHLKDISFDIRKGQIAGIWANEPYALKDLRGIVSGEYLNYRGTMTLCEKEYHPRNYGEAVKLGVEYIDIMWYEKHCIPDMSIMDNLMLENYWLQKPVFAVMSRKWKKYRESKYRQRHPDWPRGKWRELTPDQQRLLLYERCLEQPGKLYFISEAFTKSNYQMTEEVIRIMQELLDKDKTLVLESMNFQDLGKVCEEIYLIKDGCLVKRVSKEEFESIDVGSYV